MNEVDVFLSSVAPKQKMELERVRTLVKKTIPSVTEGIGYGMPVFKFKGKYLRGYAAFKNHMSVFPGAEAIELLKEKLQDFTLSKGTVQFTLEHPLPEDVLIELLNVCRDRIESK